MLEQNELRGCGWGVNTGIPWSGTVATKPYVQGPRLTANYLHHNVWAGATGTNGSGAYGITNTTGAIFENNEIALSGSQAKFLGTFATRVSNNFVHHNGNGIWFDGDNLQAVMKGTGRGSGRRGYFLRDQRKRHYSQQYN